jgi:hypothetical protein
VWLDLVVLVADLPRSEQEDGGISVRIATMKKKLIKILMELNVNGHMTVRPG